MSSLPSQSAVVTDPQKWLETPKCPSWCQYFACLLTFAAGGLALACITLPGRQLKLPAWILLDPVMRMLILLDPVMRMFAFVGLNLTSITAQSHNPELQVFCISWVLLK